MQLGQPFNPFGLFTGLFIPNCIAQSEIKDADKLLLGRLFQYAGRDGQAFPSRKKLAEEMSWQLRKLDRAIASLKATGLIETTQVDEHSPSTYIFLYHELYENRSKSGGGGTVTGDKGGAVTEDSGGTVIDDNHNKFNKQQVHKQQELPKGNVRTVVRTTKNIVPVETKKRTALKKRKLVSPETLTIIKYWNSFDCTTTHTLVQKRSVYYDSQNKTVKSIDDAIVKILAGSYYTKHKVAVRFQIAIRVDQIKKSIDRFCLGMSAEYTQASVKKMSLMNFLFNPRMEVLDNDKVKYRNRYPLLHYLNNEPIKAEDNLQVMKSEYPILVERVKKGLCSSKGITGKQENLIIKQVDKAITFLKRVSNGNFAENRMQLPVLLINTMEEERLPLTVDNLALGVYNLEKFMRKRLMIQ